MAAPSGTRTSLSQRSSASILQSQKKQGCIPYGKISRLDYDDVLTTPVVSELTGYSAQSIQRWCNQKILVGFKIRGTLTIPRLAVVEFMSGDRATAIVRKSSKHLDLLRTYRTGLSMKVLMTNYNIKRTGLLHSTMCVKQSLLA